ncbi:hypothetical protein BN1221_00068c [Brenneria goodwinii]|uniref:Uncharacterized protein n=1 Tax=Brenneria goodwinii TaxID=1109412 RepID=A0A0G4JP27_9GAMM|nr:hypothetical protein BN1221_00068c [Brenneria goodwinii]
MPRCRWPGQRFMLQITTALTVGHGDYLADGRFNQPNPLGR